MKTAHLAIIGAGVLGVGAIFLYTRKAQASAGYIPPVRIQETEADRQAKQDALLRSAVGAKAATGSSSGLGSVISMALASPGAQSALQGAGITSGNAQLDGAIGAFAASAGTKAASKAGSYLSSAGDKAVSAIKKILPW